MGALRRAGTNRRSECGAGRGGIRGGGDLAIWSALLRRNAFQQLVDLFARHFLALDQGLGETLKIGAVLFENLVSPLICFAEKPLHLFVDDLRSAFAEITRLLNFLSQEDVFLPDPE